MNTLLRMLAERRAYWRLWALPVICVAVAAPMVIALPLVERYLIDDVMLTGQLDHLGSTIMLYAGLWLGVAVTNIVGSVLRAQLDERLTVVYYRRLYIHCTVLSVPFWNTSHTGRFTVLFNSDI